MRNNNSNCTIQTNRKKRDTGLQESIEQYLVQMRLTTTMQTWFNTTATTQDEEISNQQMQKIRISHLKIWLKLWTCTNTVLSSTMLRDRIYSNNQTHSVCITKTYLPVYNPVKYCNNNKWNKKLRYCRRTMWRTMSVEILSTVAQMYKMPFKSLQKMVSLKDTQGHWNCCYSTGHISFLKLKMGHVTLTMTIWGAVCHLWASTCYDQLTYKFWTLYLH